MSFFLGKHCENKHSFLASSVSSLDSRFKMRPKIIPMSAGASSETGLCAFSGSAWGSFRQIISNSMHGIGNDLSERPPSTARKRAQSGFRRRARRHWNDLGAHFESTVKLETELAKKECLFSQCFPKKNDITSTHFLQSILFHPDGLLIEAVTDREMFWLELAPAGWARFDKVASHQDGKAADHSTDRGIFALRELQSTREPWPEGSTMTLAAFCLAQSPISLSDHPAYQAMKSLVSQVEAS